MKRLVDRLLDSDPSLLEVLVVSTIGLFVALGLSGPG